MKVTHKLGLWEGPAVSATPLGYTSQSPQHLHARTYQKLHEPSHTRAFVGMAGEAIFYEVIGRHL